MLEIRIGNQDEPNLKKNSLCGEPFRFREEAWRRVRCPVPLLGRFVTITRLVDSGNLILCEVEVRQEGKLIIDGNLLGSKLRHHEETGGQAMRNQCQQNKVCLLPIFTFKFPARRHLGLHDVIWLPNCFTQKMICFLPIAATK